MASKDELPEEVNKKLLGTLGEEVEMKTFKTNVIDIPIEDGWLAKIICVGDYTGGVGTKGVFIEDYLQNRTRSCCNSSRPPPVYLKNIRWQRREKDHEPISITLQFWEIHEKERFANVTKVYFKDSHGALVFWGTCNPSSMDGVPKWLTLIKEVCPSIPCVLITDNVAKPKEPLQCIGPGKMFESELALDQFCKDQGFVGHFEIKSRDWVSGEKSVFGQAVNCLLEEILLHEQRKPKEILHNKQTNTEEILQKEQTQTKTWMSHIWKSIKPHK